MLSRLKTLVPMLLIAIGATAQEPVYVGAGSYASYVPLSESRTTEHDGCQAYQTEHRHLYIEDSLAYRPVPTNDWWTYMLVNQWTGNLWAYPAMVRAENGVISINYPDYWEPTGCEMKWDKTLTISADDFHPSEAILSDWGDFHISFVMKDDNRYVKTTLMMGSPLVWMEYHNLSPKYDNTLPKSFATFERKVNSTTYLTVALLTEGLTANDLKKYAFNIPFNTHINYSYDRAKSQLSTTFSIKTTDLDNTDCNCVIAGFIPHHYRNTTTDFTFREGTFRTPRGTLRLAEGNHFTINYDVHTMLPYFPAPASDLQGYDLERMRSMIADYAKLGSFGADTYWGGKGLIQMAHYMTFAQQIGDKALFEQTKSRLKEALINWLTYTPGEKDFYFARYQRFGSLVGFDTSYDSDTFNDHHFHYGYFVYSAALLCLFDDDFRNNYGQMARVIALDYANWLNDLRFPKFRTFTPWLGHSFAGGMGGEGGNGQESSSEAMQSWGAIWMLGAALGDSKMLEAGIFGYTLESRATAEYWFDRSRQNIQYDLYKHPYCCNLTSQGVGWWTWFSGDPVWMHSIQWMPISPLLTNYLAEDTTFARWDYSEMYKGKEIGNYEAQSGGLADESGLGNVCLSYLSLFDPDSAARVFDRAWNSNKALAKNADTGGITYWLTHAHRSLGNKRFDIKADYPLAAAYSNGTTTTFAVYNAEQTNQKVTFTLPDGTTRTFSAPAGKLMLFTDQQKLTSIQFEPIDILPIHNASAVQTTQTYPIPLHFYDQYGVEIRPDSLVQYTTKYPVASGYPYYNYQDTITAQYQGLTDTLIFTVRSAPEIKSGRLLPDIKYVQYGDKVTFRCEYEDQFGETHIADKTIDFIATQIGQQDVKYTLNLGYPGYSTMNFRQTVTVLPPFPNIALHKPAFASSEENGGTKAVNATDGDKSTRWGSAHQDGETIVVDLQSISYIRNIVVRWEAAYASEYALEISNDSVEWHTYNQICSGGNVNTMIEAEGRYVRLKGLQRATTYGISLYELEVYGVSGKDNASNIFGINITSDKKVINAGDTVAFSALCYNIEGIALRYAPTLAITTNNAIIENNTVICPTAGIVTLLATAQDATAEYTWIVQETEHITNVTISPKEITLPIGTSQVFTVEAKNQFGVAQQTDYITYQADQAGDYTVVGNIGSMSDTARVHAVPFSEVNLALNKPVSVSGSENGGTAGNNAVDGNMQTRWSSRFQDEEWIEIDLQNLYYLTSVRLLWEASFATAYTIQVSIDAKDYTTIYSTTDGKGGEEKIEFGETLGRYIRLICHSRNSGYGSSLWEFEVYGSGILETGIEEPLNNSVIDFDLPYEVFNIVGQRIMLGSRIDVKQMQDILPQGVYILRQNNKSIKIKL